jgi:hypothetical protein
LAPFEDKEIKAALFQMYPIKAPGPMASQHIFFSAVGIFAGKRSPEQF